MTTSRVPFEEDELPQEQPSPAPPNAPKALKWTPQPMVRWFDPVQLANTGIRALLSSIFGAYADKREVQAALARDEEKPTIHDYSQDDNLWIDFTADLGDGFDSTYTVAWLMAQQQLAVAGAESPGAHVPSPLPGGQAQTERGRVLILGGDQVYPTASREEYANRFAGPYEAALPWAQESQRPRMFAVPGNHDWYDGLTSFMRLYCQQRWIGGWQTRQTRSYFALKLPHRWWLLGIDIQLGADVDKPQLEYFARIAQEMEPGDQVILCTAQPAWVESKEHPTAYDNLAFFERTILCPRKVKLMVTLTGDLHHYARYTDSAGERHKITSGGGGAYLYGTHLLPEEVELPKAEVAEPGRGSTAETKTYTCKQVYPSHGASKRLRGGALLLGLRNPGFVVFLGIVYTLYAWLLQDVSRIHLTTGNLLLWLSSEPFERIGTVVGTVLRITLRAPILAAFAALFIYSLYKFCAPDPGRPKWFRLFGAVHGAAHLSLVLLLSWVFAKLNIIALGIVTPEVQAVAFFLEMLLIGGPLGAFLFGLSLLPGTNFNEAYSSQHLEGYKNFLRMNVTPQGALTIYPIGIPKAKKWVVDNDAEPGAPYFRPRDGVPPLARLIENPITVPAPADRRVLAHSLFEERA